MNSKQICKECGAYMANSLDVHMVLVHPKPQPQAPNHPTKRKKNK